MHRLDKRGISDLVAVLVATLIVFGFSTLYMISSVRGTELQTWGIVAAMRLSEIRVEREISIVVLPFGSLIALDLRSILSTADMVSISRSPWGFKNGDEKIFHTGLTPNSTLIPSGPLGIKK